MNDRQIKAHMSAAEVYANLSYAIRLKVGAIVVKDNRVISIGYNGTPAGWDNDCEDQTYEEDGFHIILKTKPEVIHAEANAIAKLARTHESGLDSVMFITHAPCMDCAKLIFGAGIKNVFYKHPYRDTTGLNFLEKSGVQTTRIE